MIAMRDSLFVATVAESFGQPKRPPLGAGTSPVSGLRPWSGCELVRKGRRTRPPRRPDLLPPKSDGPTRLVLAPSLTHEAASDDGAQGLRNLKHTGPWGANPAMSDEGDQRHIPVPKPTIDWTFSPWGLAGLLLQASALVWWGAGIDGRVSRLEADSKANAGLPAVIARMDQRAADDSALLQQLRQDVRQLSEERK